jgi:hypothetical protein
MKKGILLVLSVVAAILIDSCTPGELEYDIIDSPPVITIENPGALVKGVAKDLKVTIKDGPVSPGTTATLEVLSGTTVLRTRTLNIVDGANKITFAASENRVSELENGRYTFRVSATDSKGVSTSSKVDFFITPCALPTSCVVNNRVTIFLLAPNDLPSDAKVGFVGAITGWGGLPDIPMNRIAAGCYCAAVDIKNDDRNAFKFRIDNSWGKEQATTTCDALNPDWRYTGGVLFVAPVPKFKGFGGC